MYLMVIGVQCIPAMRRNTGFIIGLAAIAIFAMNAATATTAFAGASVSPTVAKSQTYNFRRIDFSSRLRPNNRSIQAQAYNTSTGSLTTFQSRAQLFRNAYLENLSRSLYERTFGTNVSEKKERDLPDSADASAEARARRLSDALQQKASRTTINRVYRAEENARLRDIRSYSLDEDSPCYGLSRVRLSKCLYNLREEGINYQLRQTMTTEE